MHKTFPQKSRVLEGIDLEFTKAKNYYIIEIKSGPNWGNSSQIKRMKDNFKNATTTLLKTNPKLNIVAVNVCCYGIESQPNKDGYQKICGQEFWELISDNSTVYLDIIEPLAHKAKEKNEEFLNAYAKVVNKFTLKFAQDFCDDSEINWKNNDLVFVLCLVLSYYYRACHFKYQLLGCAVPLLVA